MAKKESFVLVSLNEDKAKKLAQIISNDTSRGILDFLSDREDVTESELAKELNQPISTIHYNLQHLMKGGLITVEEFHYSEKGKEVNHYKLANKFIIIAPKSTWGLKEKLRKILPVAGLTLGVSAVLQFISSITRMGGASLSANTFQAKDMAMEAAPRLMAMEEAVVSAAPEAVNTATEVVVQSNIWQHAALWFLVGGVVAIILMLFFDWVKEK